MERAIFLDTNVFESAKFSFDSHNFNKFLDICDEKEICLCITDVIKHEVVKRIESNLNDIFEKIDKNSFSLLAKSLDLASSGKMELIKQLSKKLTTNFDEFISDYNIEIVSSEFDQKELINLYFSKQVPFTEQKKHEFPDAIILLTITKWAEKNDKQPIVISNDKGLSDFCTINDIDCYSKISDITNALVLENPAGELLKLYNELLIDIKAQIIKELQSRNDDFILYSYDSIDEVYVDNIQIANIDINKIDVLDINEDENYIEVEVDVSIYFTLNASYPDEDTMHYDKEDGVYYFFSHNHVSIETVEKTYCSTNIYLYKDTTEFDLHDFEISNNEFEFSLNENTIQSIETTDSFQTT